MQLDAVESAENLLAVVAHYMGPDSNGLAWAKQQLMEGHDPKAIAEAMLAASRGPSAAT